MMKEEYFVIIREDNEMFHNCIFTEKALAELWEENEMCGYAQEILAFQFDGQEMKKINVYELATAYLEKRDAIQKEYEEYTEYVNEYGYDYQDNLEMGFNPYEGAYDYDC